MSGAVAAVAWAVGLAAALLVADRLLLAAEARGWIYYRRRKPNPGSLGDAMLRVQGMIEPGQAHVAEAREARPVEIDAEGDPPEPASGQRRPEAG